jgi:hypothetical protein
MSIEVMKQALEALNRINRDSVSREHAQLMSEEAITALRQAIEKAEYEQPFCYHDGRDIVGKEFADHSDVFPLYTAPPQRQPVQFPTMLRKMWSGGEVQEWLDEHVNKENT